MASMDWDNFRNVDDIKFFVLTAIFNEHQHTTAMHSAVILISKQSRPSFCPSHGSIVIKLATTWIIKQSTL